MLFMQNNLKVVLIQANLVWENPIQNRLNFTEKINQIKEQVDLIILPEMFTTGFSMQPQKIGDTMHGETVKWMRKIASEKDTAIAGSVIIFENNNFYNRFLFVHPSGEINFYDKRHLFTLAGEDKVYESGKEKLIVNYKGWKICPLVCYDLRFPVWARNVEAYDLLIYVANWAKTRLVPVFPLIGHGFIGVSPGELVVLFLPEEKPLSGFFQNQGMSKTVFLQEDFGQADPQ